LLVPAAAAAAPGKSLAAVPVDDDGD